MKTFLNKPSVRKLRLLITICCLIFDIIFVPIVIRDYKILHRRQTGGAPISLPQPIFYGNNDYCYMDENTRDSDRAREGTPIPYDEVVLEKELAPEATSAPKAQNVVPTSTQPAIPTNTPPIEPIIPQKMEVVKVGEFKDSNYHIVFVGMGYSISENSRELASLIAKIQSNFAGVNIDFAYVNSPQHAKFVHIDQSVQFESVVEQTRIINLVKMSYPADGIFFAVKTKEVVGTSHGEFAILTSIDPNTVTYATHEIGHQLGLGDGYSGKGSSFYSDDQIPSSELFYMDEMPYYLSEALKKLPEVPPLYEMGMCRGKKVYQFYNPVFNIMSDNTNHTDPKPWGSVFTPLQVIEMNLFIEDLK